MSRVDALHELQAKLSFSRNAAETLLDRHEGLKEQIEASDGSKAGIQSLVAEALNSHKATHEATDDSTGDVPVLDSDGPAGS